MAAESGRATAFQDSVAAALSYWHEKTRQLNDADIWALDAERHNLFRAVQFGLLLPQAWSVLADVALQVHPLVEQRGYWEEWIPVLEALVKCPSTGALAIEVRLLSRLGQLYRHLTRLEQATEVHLQAVQVAVRLNDPQIMAEARCDLSHDYVACRKYELAEQAGQAALEGLTGATGEERRYIAYALQALATVARARADYQLAERHLTQAVAIRRELGNYGLLAATLNELANLSRWAGELDQAIDGYREAADLLAGSHHELDWSSFTANLGSALFAKGDYAAAEAAFRQADTPYLRRSGHVRLQASLTVSLGNVLLKQNRLAEAAAYLRQSAVLWEQCEDDLERANAIGSLGEVLAAQGDQSAARPLFEKAITLLDGFPDHDRARRLQAFFEDELGKAVTKQASESNR